MIVREEHALMTATEEVLVAMVLASAAPDITDALARISLPLSLTVEETTRVLPTTMMTTIVDTLAAAVAAAVVD